MYLISSVWKYLFTRHKYARLPDVEHGHQADAEEPPQPEVHVVVV